MLVLLSPSKTLDETPQSIPADLSQPVLLEHTQQLHRILQDCSVQDLRTLMHISDKLAELNYQRYQDFSLPFTEANAKAALFMFKGDVYDAMPVAEYTAEDLSFAQAHLRILSGFYGLLRPLDLMQPYRLEMGTGLKNERGRHLYDFWGEHITQEINQAVEGMTSPMVVNLASQEYAKAVKPDRLDAPILSVDFKDERGGQYKTIGLLAKRARGMMADYMIRHRLEDAEALKKFDMAGYIYAPERSSDSCLCFMRSETAGKAA